MLTFSPRSTTWLLETHKAFQPKFYGGSKLLNPLAERTGLQIDQFNFLVCQVLALAFAFPFRRSLGPDKVSVTARHLIEVFGGVLLTFFCFGYQIWHMVIQSLVSYVFMNYGKSRFSHSMTSFWCFFYLAVVYIYHMLYDYERWTLDITIPLMIQTQKITALAFALHDGRYKDQDNLTEDQRNQAVRKMPNLLEFLSFMFYFHGVMVGPNTFYRDYQAFIDGSNMKVANNNKEKDGSGPTEGVGKRVFINIATALGCAAGMVYLPSTLPVDPSYLRTSEWYTLSFLNKCWYLHLAILIARLNSYFTWKFAEATNIAAGFGFSDYDKDGNPVYDHAENVDIKGVELSTTVEETFGSWNKKKVLWLRRVVTDRCGANPKVMTALVSATIHGFYPGYFLTFCVIPAFVATAQLVNQNIRPMVQGSNFWRLAYDLVGFIVARLTMSYLFFPYLVIMELVPCLFIYKSLYFYLHMVFMVTYILVVMLAGIKKVIGQPKSNNDGASSRGGSAPPSAAPSAHTTAKSASRLTPKLAESRSAGQRLAAPSSTSNAKAPSRSPSAKSAKSGSKSPAPAPSSTR